MNGATWNQARYKTPCNKALTMLLAEFPDMRAQKKDRDILLAFEDEAS